MEQKKNSNSDKKDTTNKKFLFTLLQSTVNVRVSAYETTLKKMYQQLMKDIKKYPEDVIDTLKEKKKEDVISNISLSLQYHLAQHLMRGNKRGLRMRRSNWIMFNKKCILASMIRPWIQT